MGASLLWLAVGAFAIGTESFVIAGILPMLAADLDVPVALAGQLVTAFAVTYAVGAPVMAVLTGGLERKRLLACALALFALANLAAALAPGYHGLMAARVLQAIAAATFMPAASAYAAMTAAPERRGRAISILYTGFTAATILGVPLGTLAGDRFGWRVTFAAVAVAAVVALAGVLGALRRLPADRGIGLADRLAVARRPEILVALSLTVFGLGGAFTIYTYLSPYLAAAAGFGTGAITATLVLFGCGAALGNLLGGQAADRYGPRRVLAFVLAGLAVLFVAMAVVPGALPREAGAIAAVVLVGLWGTVGWAFPSAQQMRLVTLDPPLAAVTLSLNSSATYVGVSLGAVLGGVTVASHAATSLGFVAAACEIVALATLVVVPRRRPQPA
jgi:predicted MFS family arabinose efflux permease